MSSTWRERDSDVYRSLAQIAVPDRQHQIATLLTLIPFPKDAAFTAVELGCGEGLLAAAFLDCFPNASVVALDGSDAMRQTARNRTQQFGDRGSVAPFELTANDWVPLLDGAGCIVSSLVLHHLDAAAKKRVFSEAARRLSRGGALLIADLIEPARIESREVYAAMWDQSAARQAREMNTPQALDLFHRERWNYYRFPDPVDQPSGLAEQLEWLRAAGFAYADCFWLSAGHAIYGGYLADGQTGTLSYREALGSVSLLR